jgi:hypothetical protein
LDPWLWRGASDLFSFHDEPRVEIRDIRYMWRDSRAADGKRSGLHSYYYILNNLIRNTAIPSME